MTQSLVVKFTKMEGAGNDFLVFDNRTYEFAEDELSEIAVRWCQRHFGIGADGLLALDEPTSAEANYRMHYVNADGSRATMCGNGARCLARFAWENGFGGSVLTFDTDAGLYRAVVVDGGDDRVRLFVPAVTDLRPGEFLDGPVPDGITDLHFLHAGTEHLVAFVGDVDAIPVAEWGRALRQDPALEPTGANANFVTVESKDTIRLRTYEKGVEAETLSCGTGVLAAAVVAEETGRVTENPVTVHAPGGTLRVGTATTPRGEERYLEGPAHSVFEGTFTIVPTD